MVEAIQEVVVKRPRGNPNFGKKKPVDAGGPVAATPITKPKVTTEAEVWVTLYAAILGTYNAPGSGAVLGAAALATDMAVAEYKKRFAK